MAGMRDNRVVVVGQGYVGLPLAMCAVEAGYDVVGLDTDPHRVTRLTAGQSYVEDISDETLAQARATGRYMPALSYNAAAHFAVAVVTVPTPLHEGTPDLRFIEDSLRSLSDHLSPGATVILESTTYPGTTENVVRPLLEKGSGLIAGVDFHLGYSPERIDPGNPSWTFVNTPKVVSGVNDESLRHVQGFYDTLVDKTVAVSGTREAETTKLLENTFRHVNIALVNEMAIFAHQLGIDLAEAIDAASTKPFGYMPFTPGPGVGGHCLPVDPSYLSWEVKRTLGRSFRFVELANDINGHMPTYVVQRIIETLNRRHTAVSGARILQLGLAYKRNSGDCRESPAVRVAQLLHALDATVRVIDSHVDPNRIPGFVTMVPLTPEEVAAADLVVVLTDHDDVDYDLLANAASVFDTRNRVRIGVIERL
jgi:UDP-N-acetyl-D-mannosaminuronic acid dehydrogenase/UDP-N-acetyl-D-glucosamine dehydrogenase